MIVVWCFRVDLGVLLWVWVFDVFLAFQFCAIRELVWCFWYFLCMGLLWYSFEFVLGLVY